MNFAWPQLLWLVLAPAGWLAWELGHRRRAAPSDHPHILRAEAGAHSLEWSAPSPANAAGKRSRPRFWLVVGLALTVVALARPQWGRIDEPVFDQSREILLALDLSRSMLTPDVQPSRLDRAKLLIQSLLDRLAGERVGLEIFSGTAFIQAPLSANYEILREFLPSLGPDYMPEGGTDYAALIDAAAGAFSSGPGADRFLIILSDGGATDDNWRSHVKRLTERGIRVIGLGIGTQAGGLIPDGAGGFMKDENGAVVMAKLESGTLRELSGRTVGAYRDASDWIDLAGLLKTTVEAGRRGKFVEKNTVRYVERFQWALAPALLCLLVSFWKEFPVRPKPRDLRLAAKGGKELTAAAVTLVLLAALGFLPSASGAEAATLPPSALLGKIVGRLSTQDASSGPDWAEFAHETVTWGEDLQTNHQPVPEGPVRDGLAAVDTGGALDAKAADWPQLRSQLEALLKQSQDEKKKELQQEQKKQQQENKQQNQQQNQQPQDQQKSSPQSQQNSGNPPQSQNQPSQAQNSPQSQQQNSGNPPPSPGSNPPPSSAFGDLQKPASPPPPSGTQQVGGEPKQKDPDPAQADPALTMSLQKLDQIHNQDSPAQLFQMLENHEPHPEPDKKGKNW